MSRERGFSLVEVTVALLLLSVGFALASGLLIESGRQLAWSGQSLRGPEPIWAETWLRRDIRYASLGGGGSAWAAGPLVLSGAEGPRSWILVGGRLYRATPAGAGPVLDAVTAFRWRIVGGETVAVELTREQPGRGGATVLTRSVWLFGTASRAERGRW